MNAVMNLRVPQNAGNCLISWHVSFSRRTLLHGVSCSVTLLVHHWSGPGKSPSGSRVKCTYEYNARSSLHSCQENIREESILPSKPKTTTPLIPSLVCEFYSCSYRAFIPLQWLSFAAYRCWFRTFTCSARYLSCCTWFSKSHMSLLIEHLSIFTNVLDPATHSSFWQHCCCTTLLY